MSYNDFIFHKSIEFYIYCENALSGFVLLWNKIILILHVHVLWRPFIRFCVYPVSYPTERVSYPIIYHVKVRVEGMHKTSPFIDNSQTTGTTHPTAIHPAATHPTTHPTATHPTATHPTAHSTAGCEIYIYKFSSVITKMRTSVIKIRIIPQKWSLLD